MEFLLDDESAARAAAAPLVDPELLGLLVGAAAPHSSKREAVGTSWVPPPMKKVRYSPSLCSYERSSEPTTPIEPLPSMMNSRAPGQLVLSPMSPLHIFDEAPESKPLSRKAQLARASRLRKKQYVHCLERQVTDMEKEIEELQTGLLVEAERSRKRVSGGEVEDDHRHDEQEALRKQLVELSRQESMRNGAESPTLTLQIKKVFSRFIANSRERQSKVDYFFNRLGDCATPSLPSKFFVWSLCQDEEFFERPGLWSSLRKEIGLTTEQLDELRKLRFLASKQRCNLAMVHEQMARIRDELGRHCSTMRQQIDIVSDVLTPWQLARYCRFLHDYGWFRIFCENIWLQEGRGLGSVMESAPGTLHSV